MVLESLAFRQGRMSRCKHGCAARTGLAQRPWKTTARMPVITEAMIAPTATPEFRVPKSYPPSHAKPAHSASVMVKVVMNSVGFFMFDP